jgi:phosphate acetyltransferase
MKSAQNNANSGHKPVIALPEAENVEVLKAYRRTLDSKEFKVVLVGKFDDIAALAAENNLNVSRDDVIETDTDPLTEATKLLGDEEIDGLVAGVDHTTRDVVISVKNNVGLADNNKTFCSLFAIDFPDRPMFVLSDGGVIKNPTAEQLTSIAILTNDAAARILERQPIIAMLSFSTLGSGGPDESITKINEAIESVRELRPDIIIDGEMQLDAAVNPRVGAKKAPESPVAGKANVLITPDLNSGNILYKSLEQFAGAHAYGPVLLGFKKPVSDLSRGSTVDDIVGSIKIVAAQAKEEK